MRRWLKEPLLHFLALGALIFFVYGVVAQEEIDENEIFVSRGQQENLVNTFSRTWQRLPTPEEYQGLLRDYIREEIAYRQTRDMGLDENDIVIRRRLRQKLEMLAEDVAGLVPPTDAELQAYLEANPEDFALEPRLSLHQLYFSADRRGERAREDAAQQLAVLGSTGAGPDWEARGDPLPLPATLEDTTPSGLGRLFGDVFVAELDAVEPGKWQGPVQSGYGWHLVYVFDRQPGRQPELAEVRSGVERDVLVQRRRESIDRLYDELAANYLIEIEPLGPPRQASAGRQ
jgi:hypothetical protein